MPTTSRTLTTAISVVALLAHASTTTAQTDLPSAQPATERYGFGVAGAIGLPGRLAGVRVSLPATDQIAADLTLGRVHGRGDDGVVLGGTSFSAQIRWLWRGRDSHGHSGYWFGGPIFLGATNRTQIRWPDGKRTTKIDDTSVITGQFGYGWDWLTPHGARTGLELSTGGNEGGPMIFAHGFLVWGPTRR
jgi:hypothetical protein